MGVQADLSSIVRTHERYMGKKTLAYTGFSLFYFYNNKYIKFKLVCGVNKIENRVPV